MFTNFQSKLLNQSIRISIQLANGDKSITRRVEMLQKQTSTYVCARRIKEME